MKTDSKSPATVKQYAQKLVETVRTNPKALAAGVLTSNPEAKSGVQMSSFSGDNIVKRITDFQIRTGIASQHHISVYAVRQQETGDTLFVFHGNDGVRDAAAVQTRQGEEIHKEVELVGEPKATI